MAIVSRDIITTAFYIDEKGRKHFRHTQYIGDILRENEAMRNDKGLWGKNKNSKLIGQIDEATYQDLQRKGIAEDNKELKKFLERNPEYKTTKKRI